jgi:hypothetical protein
MADAVYQDEMDPQHLGFPRQKADRPGRKPVVTEATAENWKVPFPLSDGSDGEPEDKEPPLYDDHSDADLTDADEAKEPLQEGKFSGCNHHAARKGRPTRRMRGDTHNGEVQRLPARNPDDASSESDLDEATLNDQAGNIEMLRDAADNKVPLAEALLGMEHRRPTSARQEQVNQYIRAWLHYLPECNQTSLCPTLRPSQIRELYRAISSRAARKAIKLGYKLNAAQ